MQKPTPPVNSRRQRADESRSAYDLAGLDLMESVLSPTGEPVLGLYITGVHWALVRSIAKRREYRLIVPMQLAIASILRKRAGISQIELARYLGITRAAVGKQITAFIRRGWARRELDAHNARRYRLFLTAKGEQMLKRAAEIVPRHERELSAALTSEERITLRRIMRKMLAREAVASAPLTGVVACISRTRLTLHGKNVGES